MKEAYVLAKQQTWVSESLTSGKEWIKKFHASTKDFPTANYHTAWCSSFVNWCMEQA